MLNIELIEPKKDTNSGSSVKKLIQNKTTHPLDLLVRESIQNSLDAHLNDNDVTVNFLTGEFCTKNLCNQIEKVGDSILEKYFDENYAFLAIRDSNTIGLVGNLDGNFKTTDKNQNLGKLCFHVLKPQDKEGAGGSWGVGKTVYFRIGCGLVFYYSRIKNGNDYEERLAGTLVEDETRNDGLLSFYENNIGVAYFGKRKCDSNEIEAIVDKDEIHSFLNIFNIKPYKNDETGTTVIIPFTSGEILGSESSIDGNPLFWKQSIQEFLKISTLRWYFPRMVENYKYGPKLQAFVDGEKVETDENTPVFKKLNELANSCYLGESTAEWITVKAVERNANLETPVVGYFAFGKVTRDELGIIRYHLPTAYDYLDLANESSQNNKPIIGFCRKPGMIVNYSIDGPCCGSLTSLEDEYILGLFILNSNNKITSPTELSLEEYFRGSEKADHAYWEDYAILITENKKLIIKNIYNSIHRILCDSYGIKDTVYSDSDVSYNLARKIGKLLLPDENFGRQGSSLIPRKNGGRGGKVTVKKVKNLFIELTDRTFKTNCLTLKYEFKVNKEISFINVTSKINTSSEPENANAFENDENKEFPFEIHKILVMISEIDGKSQIASGGTFDLKQSFFQYKGLIFQPLTTDIYNKVYGFKISKSLLLKGKDISFFLSIDLKTNDKHYESMIDFDAEE